MLVPGASADVSGNGFFDLTVIRRWIFSQQGMGAHENPWRAEPALNPVIVKKGLLDPV